MFLLGSEGLKSMIQNEASRPLVFSAAYYQTAKLAGHSKSERKPGHYPCLPLRHETGSARSSR